MAEKKKGRVAGAASTSLATPRLRCRKAPHDNPHGGYMHGADDDGPFDVDGVEYCGRCHRFIGANGGCENGLTRAQLSIYLDEEVIP